ncbi:MAG: NUDIX hydrolase [Planctomycetota bacterium]|nr:NUDIX hydrolase [Planctomycetota bacterium]
MTDPDLAPEPDLAVARAIVAGYGSQDPAQLELRVRILDWIEAHPGDAHRRTCLAGHLTASTLLWDAAGERVLLHHHRKLDRWLQFGGHCDGDANLRGVAWRETVEESGIEPAWFSPGPVDLDIHPIPGRGEEPEHLHLDVRYLARAPRGAMPACSQESKELRWLRPDEARGLGVDGSVARLLDLGPLG